MNLSIFNFEYFGRYLALPRRDRVRHVLSIAFLLAVGVLSTRVPEWVYGRYGCHRATFRTAAIEALSPRTKVLCVGSSHVLGGFRPDLFSVPAMNLTTPGLNYEGAEIVLANHLKRVPNLQVAVVEWGDVPLMVDTMLAMNRDYRAFLELGVAPSQLPARDRWQKLRVMWDATCYPIVNLPRVTPMMWRGWRLASSDSCPSEAGAQNTRPGFAPQNRFFDRTKYQHAPFFLALTTMADDRDLTRRNRDALIRIIDRLRRQGAKVVLLQLPHHALYWQKRPAMVQQIYNSTQTALRTRYANDPEVRFWNWGLRRDFSDRDFADGDHLNAGGARHLTRLVDRQLRPLLQH